MGLIRNIKDKGKEIIYIAAETIKSGVIKVKDLITNFFSKALNMMKTVINKLESRVRGVILGASHFIRRVGNKYQEGTKNYSLEEEIGEWNETTVTRNIELKDLPPEYQTMDDEFEIDDTVELEAAIAC